VSLASKGRAREEGKARQIGKIQPCERLDFDLMIRDRQRLWCMNAFPSHALNARGAAHVTIVSRNTDSFDLASLQRNILAHLFSIFLPPVSRGASPGVHHSPLPTSLRLSASHPGAFVGGGHPFFEFALELPHGEHGQHFQSFASFLPFPFFSRPVLICAALAVVRLKQTHSTSTCTCTLTDTPVLLLVLQDGPLEYRLKKKKFNDICSRCVYLNVNILQFKYQNSRCNRPFKTPAYIQGKNKHAS
jgi:hypothetical protein